MNRGYFCDSRKIIIFGKFVVLRKKCKKGVLVILTKKGIFVILHLGMVSSFEKRYFSHFGQKGYFGHFGQKGHFGNLGKKGYFRNFDKKGISVILHLRVK